MRREKKKAKQRKKAKSQGNSKKIYEANRSRRRCMRKEREKADRRQIEGRRRRMKRYLAEKQVSSSRRKNFERLFSSSKIPLFHFLLPFLFLLFPFSSSSLHPLAHQTVKGFSWHFFSIIHAHSLPNSSYHSSLFFSFYSFPFLPSPLLLFSFTFSLIFFCLSLPLSLFLPRI